MHDAQLGFLFVWGLFMLLLLLVFLLLSLGGGGGDGGGLAAASPLFAVATCFLQPVDVLLAVGLRRPSRLGFGCCYFVVCCL